MSRIRALAPLAVSVLLVSGAVAALRIAAAPRPARVTLDSGTIEGVRDSTSNVLVFRGVPYAAPPVGSLRWRPPRPVAHWRGVRSASRLGHNCMQAQIYGDIDPFAAGVSEDCLYLNVWTTGTSGARRPVMVWIHGGGFFAGFGGEERHDGTRLAQKGAVVVTLNYRLGAFGFLAHPALRAESPHHAAGNYGLLDQIAALRWVHRNIARFGGDPARVTIFGESAGGMSVGALVASPLAAGLFQRAILESGTGIGIGVQKRTTADSAGVAFATALGVAGRGAKAASQLRALSADSVLAAARAMSTAHGGAPIFWPVVDGWVLPRPVDSALAKGRGSIVPVIVGSNANEGDAVFGAPARSFARLVTAHGGRAYLYQFTRVGDDSASRRRGAYHSAEITFVFGRLHPLRPEAGSTAYDSTLAEAMSDYWVAFAGSGDPNGPPAAGRRPVWPVYHPATDAYLELGPTVRAGDALPRAVYDSLDAIGRARGEVRPQSGAARSDDVARPRTPTMRIPR